MVLGTPSIQKYKISPQTNLKNNDYLKKFQFLTLPHPKKKSPHKKLNTKFSVPKSKIHVILGEKRKMLQVSEHKTNQLTEFLEKY